MAIIVAPIELDDLQAWLEIHYEAFQSTFAFFWNQRPSPESYKLLAERRVKALSEPGSYVMKAVDTDNDNRVVGVASWAIYEKERQADEVKKSFAQPMPIPEINCQARDAFLVHINEARVKYMGTAPCVMLNSLVVHPEYQRRGIGTALMKFGVDEADRLGFRGYLEASAGGKGLYEKFGYRRVDDLVFDTKPWGGDKIDIHTVMFRDAKPLKKTQTSNTNE